MNTQAPPLRQSRDTFRGEGKGHPCTGTEALYRLYGPYGG